MVEEDRVALIAALPYARRFARALSGSQTRGDAAVAEALRAGVRPIGSGDPARAVRLGLYATVADGAAGRDADGADRTGALTQTERMLLLLTSLEELELSEAAATLGLPPAMAAAMLGSARERLRVAAAARVLIIEDEPIIAMDLQQLVESAGHEVVGLAASEDEAVAIAEAERPTLVLADVNLGKGGDGAAAVARILARHGAPVIFVTAYPERLLTGTAVEPAFVITKPFEPTTLAVATFQAVTGGMRMDGV